MALIKRWADDETGLEFPEAYHRINGLTLDLVGKSMQFVVLIYRDAAARLDGKHPFANRAFAVRNLGVAESPDGEAHAEYDLLFSVKALDVEGVNPVSQAYSWLKRHPLYAGALDG